MKKVGITLVLMCVLFAGAGVSFAEAVDPSWSGQWRKQQEAMNKKWSHWPRERIRQLEAERKQLLQQIAVLPQHNPKVLSDRLGYHSPFEEPGLYDSASASYIDVTFVWPRRIDSIALAPAFNPQEPDGGIYAFPKRFKIEVFNKETGEIETVVNWMEEDFPDPGPYPVFFSGINRYVTQIRITVPQVERESGVAYFALGELYVFLQKNGKLADNMALWGSDSIAIDVSDSFSMPPLWDSQYLRDNIVALGVPLSGEKVDEEDLVATYENGAALPAPVEVVLDLGQVQPVGRIDLWPAEAPYLLALPSIGFPREISIELSADPDFETSTVIPVENVGRRMQREDRLAVLCRGYAARYIRIKMSDLPEYKGQRILGMGEISVGQFGKVFSVGCTVSAKGIPPEFHDQLPRLVDGYTRSRKILQEGEWIKGLAKRRPLDRRLAVVERELEVARASWRRIQQRLAIWVGVVLCMVLLGGMLLQRLQRRRILKKLKMRITRDLHDEVGSNLGSITLAAKRMEATGATKENLFDLSLMAREASASLRDVVWVIDQTTIRLPALLQKLAERAERILSGVSLNIQLSPASA
ncbi:histidine kinase [Pontiella sp.]|uniref:histidine kinase n=1 Tax=Pontiella sp. TaxID=2837462 RepID=UPI0035672490